MTHFLPNPSTTRTRNHARTRARNRNHTRILNRIGTRAHTPNLPHTLNPKFSLPLKNLLPS